MRENLKLSPSDASPVQEDQSAAIKREISASVGHRRTRARHAPLLLYGVLLFCAGIAMYLLGVLLVVPRYLLGLNAMLEPVSQWIVWYSGIPIVAGIGLTLLDLLLFLDRKKPDIPIAYQPLKNSSVTVVLTAYDDEQSIAAAVEDFLGHPLVRRVIVVSNNSRDATFQRAEAAGAITFNEEAPGYGRCVFRCLTEAVKFDDVDLVVLCEGTARFVRTTSTSCSLTPLTVTL
jgi:hypothetical protein